MPFLAEILYAISILDCIVGLYVAKCDGEWAAAYPYLLLAILFALWAVFAQLSK